MTPLFRKFLGINWVIVANIIALMAFGVYAVYNAGDGRAGSLLVNAWSKQIIFCCAGVVIMIITSLFDYKWVRWGAGPFYLLAVAGLIAVKFVGKETLGAQSTIQLPGFVLQPSQLALAAGIISLALVFGELPRIASIFRYPFLRIALGGLLAVVPMLLILTEPDLGSAAVWGPVFLTMLLVGSIPFRYLIALLLVVLTILPLAYYFKLKPHQKARIDTFILMLANRENVTTENIRGDGWVPHFLELAVGSAGFDGKGPLSRKVEDQKSIHRTFLPHEVINDFISAVIAEEFGFRGMVLMVCGMSMLIFQCIFVAAYARDQLGRLMVVGLVAALMTYIFLNVGMNILLVPITGVPLPLISHANTFMLAVMFMFGLVQSVWVHRNVSPVKKGRAGRDEDEAAA
jgi:rod shape determining protein RodA